MSYEKLLKKQMIEPVRVSNKELAKHLSSARHDIKVARNVQTIDLDWAFNIAYNGILQAALTLMYHKGHRPKGEAKHYAMLEFLKETLSSEWAPKVNRMQKLRQKRNLAVYEHRGIVSEKEANDIIEFADRFYREIEATLPKEIVTLSHQEETDEAALKQSKKEHELGDVGTETDIFKKLRQEGIE